MDRFIFLRAISASNVENLVSNVAIDVVEFCVSMAYLLAAVDPTGFSLARLPTRTLYRL